MKWVIVGGGVQGCTLAINLIKSKGVDVKDLTIVDPHPEPLFIWKKLTKRVGMNYLRSPIVHHLDIEPFSLKTYGKAKKLRQSLFFLLTIGLRFHFLMNIHKM